MVENSQHPLIARWRWLASLAVIGGVVALAYTAWIPAKHRVRAQVMLLPTANDLLANSPILSGNTATPLTVLQGMFDSDAMARELSDQFKISEGTLRAVWFVRSDQTTNQLEVIDIHEIPAGIYFLQINANNNFQFKKFVVVSK